MSILKSIGGLAVALLALAAQAGPVLPSVTGPGWITDRYEPASWTNVGAYQGRNDVLGIGINNSTNAANRPPGLQGTFYNTQGRKIAVTGAVGDSVAADLFLEQSWSSSASGFVRTDLWARSGLIGNETGATYPIIGFTNYGGSPRLRVWDADFGWVDLTINLSSLFGTWVSFEIESLAAGYNFYVNGTLVYTDNSIQHTTGAFTNAFLQAYNFNDPALQVSGNPAYTVHWSNPLRNDVPLPGTLALAGLGLSLMAVAGRRRKLAT
jgi:hypothetical protein